MQRITITIDDDLLSELDEMIKIRGYQNRSDALRELARDGLHQAAAEEKPESKCVGVMCYTYDHHAPEVLKKLTESHHQTAGHEMAIANMHIHLDHDNCLEVSILKGQIKQVQDFADQIKAQRHVTNGTLVTLPVTGKSDDEHSHHNH